MATYELYIGGPPTRNYNLSMFPAVPFNETAAPFNEIGMAAHKGPIGYADTRLLDFAGDNALGDFLRNNVVAQGDTLGVVLIPKNMLYLGFFYSVEKPVAGLSITPKLRGKALTYTAIDASVVAEGFVAPGSGAIITEGPVSLALAQYDNKPDMLDLTLTAMTAETISGLRMVISPVLLAVNTGGYR